MASSRYFSSMTHEIFISDVLIIIMFTPSRDSTSNIFAATPECDRIPTPMRETLAMDSVTATDRAQSPETGAGRDRQALRKSGFGTVNEMSVIGGLADVLNDHVDHDIRIGHRPEYARRNAWAIGHSDDRKLGLIAVPRHSRHHDPFHIGIFTCHERSLPFFETGVDLHRYAIFRRELDRATLQHLGAEARHFQHFFVGDLVQLRREPARCSDRRYRRRPHPYR